VPFTRAGAAWVSVGAAVLIAVVIAAVAAGPRSFTAIGQ
jgi:hypothetical protein